MQSEVSFCCRSLATATFSAGSGTFAATSTIIRNVEDPGGICESESFDGIENFADACIEVFGDGCNCRAFACAGSELSFVFRHGGSECIFRSVQGIPGKLDIKWFAGFLRLGHELFSFASHAEDVDRVWILILEGIFVSGVAVGLVVTVLFGSATGDMPFPLVSSGVPDRLQQFPECFFGAADLFDQSWFRQLVFLFGRSSLGPVQLCRAFSGLDADSGG